MKRVRHIYKPLFGYDITEEGNLVPIEADLLLLEEIKELVEMKALSIRDGSAWLRAESSRSISHEGLRLRLKKPCRIEEDLGQE
tara:strand:- start:184 stop:435 length:252 start_codon:yes stop_codon:yes gene_type:complete